MKRFYLHIISVLALFALFVACTADTTCRRDMTVRMNVSLQADSVNMKGHSVKYSSWDSVTLRIVGDDSLLIDNRKGLKQLSLYLHPSAPELNTALTAFEIIYHEQTDTLYVEHVPRQYFVSLACGCAVYHTITNAWSTDPRVDSVQIINSNVENALQENLRIHLHE